MAGWLGQRVEEIRAKPVEDFVREVDGTLSAALAFRPITEEQHHAWKQSARLLHSWTKRLPVQSDPWVVLMEYAPPLVTTRPDILIVTPEHVVAIEAKTGAQRAGAAADRQALGYAADLFWFHPGARGRALVPVVLTAQGQDTAGTIPVPDHVPALSHVSRLTSTGVVALLADILAREQSTPRSVDPDQWLRAAYAPRPSIVDAAVALFASTEDSGVNAAISDDEELERLTALLVAQVHEAEARGEHRVLLVSGVPGAGKTLVGLRLAHDPTVIERLRDVDAQPPLYLTGNGPLVKVLVEALARDFHRRKDVPKSQARREAGVLVKLVHAFTRDGLGTDAGLDVPHVAVFDEGQRVWDAEQMNRKHEMGSAEDRSEPEVILSRLEKREWAVVVVLVGEGQEINTGETGAALWVDAIASRRARGLRDWIGLGPEHLGPTGSALERRGELFLKTTRRSIGAAWLSDWVRCVLESDSVRANEYATLARAEAASYPIVLTRDLEVARSWLRTRSSTEHVRTGLVASARAGRLRPYGLETQAEFQGAVDWPKWFLDRPPSLESSSALEVAATEFKCQGLELDYVGLAWSWDLVWKSNRWVARRLAMRDLAWRETSAEKRRYAVNAYRVLLTRGRSGLVIWVPTGDVGDQTRDPTEMDDVATYLIKCGVTPL